MIEQLSKINAGAVDCRNVAGGSFTNYTKQEILLGCVGSKPQYSALLIAMYSYTKSNTDLDYNFTLNLENMIVSDCKKMYKRQALMLLRSRGKRKPLHDDEIAILARCAICTKVENKQQDNDFADYLGVTVGQYKSKYRAVLEQCFILIEEELDKVERNIRIKLGY
jgi:hypothetical protein